MRPNDEHLFVHDNQYSVTSAVSRATRQVVERYQYSPYGKTTVLDNEFDPKDEGELTLDNKYTYTGRRLDPSGLMYFRARYYSPKLRQFISRDPLGYVDGMSQYQAYFAPGSVDPTGYSEGHHWVPVSVVTELFSEGFISATEGQYFGGRRSGPTYPSHNFGTYGNVTHAEYNKEVKRQIKRWKNSKPPRPKVETVTDRIRDGKTWDGRKSAKLKAFNDHIKRDMVYDQNGKLKNKYKRGKWKKKKWPKTNTYDGIGSQGTQTKTKICKKGRSSLKSRGKIILGGSGMVFMAGINSAAQAGTLHDVFVNGEGMRNARNAAAAGHFSKFRNALIGEGYVDPSVWEELQLSDRGIARVWYPLATAYLKRLEKQFDALDNITK